MIRLCVLGRLSIDVEGRSRPFPEVARPRALLGWLALHPGMHPRGELASRLRPDVLDESARKSLRQAAWGLRTWLDDIDASRLVRIERDAIGLAEDVSVDVRELRRLIAAGDDRAAIQLAAGELLPGIEDEWVLLARDELTAELGATLSRLAQTARRTGDREGAIEWTRRRARLEPLAEAPQRELMALLGESGDRAAALAAYDRFRDRLRRELDTLPSAETRELADRLRRGADLAAAEAPGPRASSPESGSGARPGLPVALQTPDPFAGRATALERLRQTWEAARSGPRAAFLVGEPGIGKTRLAAEIAATLHAAGACVLYGRCDEDRLRPYQPFVEALAGLGGAEALLSMGDVGTSVAPGGEPAAIEAARYAAFEGVRERLERAAREAPTLLVLDDLHWADGPSLALLRHLGRHLDEVPLLVLGTFRDTDVGEGHPMLSALAEVRRTRAVTQLSLAGLDEDAVARLVRERARSGSRDARHDPVALRARTAGNPLFVREILAHADEGGDGDGGEVPPGVQQVIAARLDRLGADAVDVLTTAAVIGQEFEIAILAEAGPDEGSWDVDDVLERACAAGLVADADRFGAGCRFAHALVADVLMDRLTARRAAVLHARVGAALVRRPPREMPAAARVARHLRAGAVTGGLESAVDWSLRAAAELRSAAAYEEAGSVLVDTLDMLDRIGGTEHPARPALLLELGESLARIGDREGAQNAFREAHRRAILAGDARVAAPAALGIGGLGTVVRTVEPETLEALEAALALVGDRPSNARSRLLARMAIEIYYADPSRAGALSEAAVAAARASGQSSALPGALNARRVAIWDAEHARERLSVADEMVVVSDQIGDREARLQGRNWRVIDLLELGRRADAELEIDRYEREADALRLIHHAWYVPLWRGCLADISGDFARGVEWRDRALELGRRSGDENAESFVSIQANQSLVDQGRLEELDLARLFEQASSSAVPSAWWTWIAVIYASLGRREEALVWFERIARDDFAALPRDANWHVVCEAAEAAALIGDSARAARLCELLAPHAELFPVVARGVALYGPVHYYLGRVAQTAGHHRLAVSHFERAIEAADAIGARPRAALARVRLAQLLAAAGEHGERAAALARAARIEASALALPRLAAEAAAIEADTS